jgi:glycerophosphoryl diester phosphodiesterase
LGRFVAAAPRTGYDLGMPVRARPLRIFVILGVFVLIASACGNDGPDSTGTPTQDEPVVTNTQATPSVAAAAAEPTDPPSGEADPLPFHIEGHRGARGLKPENTLPAFETALDIGVTTLELDLHLSADDQIIVWHDRALGPDKCRFADDIGTGAEFPTEGVPIVSLTIDQLDDYRCDVNPDPRRFPDQDSLPTAIAGAGYQPITLTALFDFVAAYAESPDKTDAQRARAEMVEFNIETKRDVDDPAAIGDGFNGVTPGRFELEVLAAVEAAGVADRVVIQSFDHRSLWAIRSVNADIRLSALTSTEAPDLADYAARGADIWSPNFNVLSTDLVDEAHAEGLLVIPWTVNTASDMVYVLELGADGLITDRPDIAGSLPGS